MLKSGMMSKIVIFMSNGIRDKSVVNM